MTDELLGQLMYEKEAANWPKPIGWENLPNGTQQLWIERAKKLNEQDLLHK